MLFAIIIVYLSLIATIIIIIHLSFRIKEKKALKNKKQQTTKL
jgi:hypothetical protein